MISKKRATGTAKEKLLREEKRNEKDRARRRTKIIQVGLNLTIINIY